MTKKIKEILKEITRQDKICLVKDYLKHNRNIVRLGIASLEDELAEVKVAWNKEKRGKEFKETKKELTQLVALGIRMLNL